jgi:hypothetical protein
MLRNKIAKFWLAISVFGIAAVLSAPSQALPSFARQTNKACSACHFQNFPMLTDYGRAFKASGFTEIYTQPTRENTDSAELSIPMVLNAAFFGTMRYDRYSGSGMTVSDPSGNVLGTTGSTSEWTLPEEASLFLSGRVASNVGFHSEVGLRPSAGLAAFKIPFSFPVGDSMRVMAIPFAADGHGPGYGFEVLNTGAMEIHSTFEDSGRTNAPSYLGLADTGASGVSAVLWDPRFFVNFTKWAPTFGPAGIGSNYAPGAGIQTGKTPSAGYFRAAYFLPTPGWDTAIGFQKIMGSAADVFDAGAGTSWTGAQIDTKLWTVDAQIQGAIGEHPLGVYFTHSEAPVSGSNPNLFNMPGTPGDGIGVNKKKATVISTSYGLIPGKINVSAALMMANNGTDSSLTGLPSSDNSFTIGVQYLFSQNVKFMFETTHLQNPGAFDGFTNTNGNIVTGIKQWMTFKLWYDM